MRSAQDFGAYLEKVDERDIDLLLLEEFHANPEFAPWFCSRIGLFDITLDGAWHSVTDADGETDLLLRVREGDSRFGILIENKIGAALQEGQSSRYHLRAARAQNEGKFNSFQICICAPRDYLDSMRADHLFEQRVAYEDIARWFEQQPGSRAKWRSYVMSEAIAQRRRGYTMVVSEANSKFHRDYWAYLARNHPRLRMTEPTPKGKKSNWIIMKGVRFPKGVQLHHKLDQCIFEIGFTNHSIEELLALRSEWPEGIQPVARGKKARASLVTTVAPIKMEAGLASQEAEMEAALKSAYRLAEFAHIFNESKASLP